MPTLRKLLDILFTTAHLKTERLLGVLSFLSFFFFFFFFFFFWGGGFSATIMVVRNRLCMGFDTCPKKENDWISFFSFRVKALLSGGYRERL